MVTFTHALPRLSQDCLAGCQTTLLRSLGIEARFQLSSSPTGAVRETHAFARREFFVTPKQSENRLVFGWGGTLDL